MKTHAQPSVFAAFLASAMALGTAAYAAGDTPSAAKPLKGFEMTSHIHVCDRNNKRSLLNLNQAIPPEFPVWAQEKLQSLFVLQADHMVDAFYEAVRITDDENIIKEILDASLAESNKENRVVMAGFLEEAAPGMFTDDGRMINEITIREIKMHVKDCTSDPLRADVTPQADRAPS
ncbi:MAG: hypothetical protein DYH13_00360 [Alphaproteobacteria bacterium PRO2]|nr:hypothetical protein [Alphaproteobacteria bacterium PRO2]